MADDFYKLKDAAREEGQRAVLEEQTAAVDRSALEAAMSKGRIMRGRICRTDIVNESGRACQRCCAVVAMPYETDTLYRTTVMIPFEEMFTGNPLNMSDIRNPESRRGQQMVIEKQEKFLRKYLEDGGLEIMFVLTDIKHDGYNTICRGSRAQALSRLRHEHFGQGGDLHEKTIDPQKGVPVLARITSVSVNSLAVTFAGYDCVIKQRDLVLDYLPNLRGDITDARYVDRRFHVGDTLPIIVKGNYHYDERNDKLTFDPGHNIDAITPQMAEYVRNCQTARSGQIVPATVTKIFNDPVSGRYELYLHGSVEKILLKANRANPRQFTRGLHEGMEVIVKIGPESTNMPGWRLCDVLLEKSIKSFTRVQTKSSPY